MAGGQKRDENVEWLSVDERAAWLATSALMVRLPAALDARLQADAGLSYVEYMVLAVLSEQDDRTMQLSDIATGVSASLSRLSHVLTRLERQDLVVRSRTAGPGRRTNATLTDAGMAKVRAAAPDHVRAVREYYLDVLGATDLARVTRIGRGVAQRVDPERPFRPGGE